MHLRLYDKNIYKPLFIILVSLNLQLFFKQLVIILILSNEMVIIFSIINKTF